MKQRYSLKSNAVKFRALALVLIAFFLGGNVAVADNWPTASGTDPTDIVANATYYIYSATDNGDGTYGFYLLNDNVDPASSEYTDAISGLTPYNYLSACRIDGGSNSTANGSGIKLTLVFNTSHPVGFVGFFCVNDGTLEMKLGDFYTNTDGITLKRTDNWTTYTNSNYNCPFTIPDNYGGNINPGNSFDYNTNEKNVDAQKIVITGKASSSTSTYDPTCQFVIDGGCTPGVNETGSGASAEYTVTYSDNTKIGKTSFFRVMCGTLNLTHVTLQNCCATSGNTGGIYVITNAGSSIDRKSSVKVDLTHCWLDHLSNSYPGIYIQYTIGSYSGNALSPWVTLTNCKFSDCYSTGTNGAIRSNSNSLCNLTMNNCTVENNYGGGVRWQSTKACTGSFINCTINNNKRFINNGTDPTDGCGGGMIIKSSASITGCTIKDNWAQKSGGGIYFSTFDEGSEINNNYKPEHGVLSLDAVDNTGTKTLIQNNTAVENGGGVAVFGNRINVAPYYGYTNSVKDGLYTMTLNMNGAIVEDNTAGQDGGGIYVSRSDKASFYKQTCVLNYGTIQGNTAGRDGGGMAIKSSSTFDNSGLTNPPSEFAPQDIVVEIGKGLDGDDTQDMKILSNTATENGGGVYVEAYSLTYNSHTSNVFTTLYGHAKIQKKDGAASGNYATNNGGGLYMKKGTVYFNGCTISDNEADNDGGGVYMEEGEITTAIRSAAEVSETPTVDPSIIDDKYKIVDYIQAVCNGSNYINTGIDAYPTHTIYVHGERGAGQGHLLYAYKSDNNRLGVRFYSGGIQYTWRNGSSGDGYHVTTNNGATSFATMNVSVTNKNVAFVMNKSTIYFKDDDGNYYGKTHSASTSTASVEANWHIFKGQVTSSNIFKFYEAKIWSGNSTISTTTGEVSGDTTLVAHLLPCYRISDNRIGVFNKALYDGTNADACFIEGTGALAIPAGSKGGPLAGDGNGTSTGSPSGTLAGLASATREVSGCTISSNKAQYDGGGIYLHNGNIFLTNTLITENQAIDSCGGGIYDHEGNIYLNYWDAADPTYGTNYTVRGETTPSEVTGNTAGRNGGGINTHKGRIFARGQSPSQDIKISGNTAGSGDNKKGSGGGIFCMGNTEDPNAEQLRLINVNLVGNMAYGTKTTTHAGETVTNGCGGAMYLQYGAINVTKCEMQGNYAEQNGGAVNNHNGVINVSGCIIGGDDYYDNAPEGNKADSCGGGIYTQHGDINITNHYDSGLDDYITKICYNTAADNGGGINTHSGKVVATGEYTPDFSKDIFIDHNTATNGSGGGIFCMGDGTGSLNDPDLLLTYVSLIGNKAEEGTGDMVNGVIRGCGGGMYLHEGAIVVQDTDMEGNYANHNGGAINNHQGDILVLGSMIGGGTYYDAGDRGEGNKAGKSGGGIYTNFGNVDIQDYIEHLQGTVRHLESKVTYNEAGENGGGINTHSGIITVNYNLATEKEREVDHVIEIEYNKAKKGGGIYANQGTIITASAKIENNRATENGGGVNNHAGDITFYGGTLSNNTAESGKGGGAFTFVGDVNILPFPVDWTGSATQPTINDGMKIYNNIAKLNGGGINNHTGRVDMRHARMKNNTSSLGNGGGIFCEGPHSNATGFTIRLLCSEVVQNKTRGQDGTEAEPTGRGGGIYLKYGSIYAHSSDILLNSANINGGGVDNHEGTMLLYGCTLDGNTAVTGRGGGIYTHSGDITTGPSIDRNDNTKSRATLIQYNTAKINGGGINNHQGNIFLNGDHILNNTAEEGHGGGIYINNGIIDMYGGKIANNEAKLGDGGGVWSGGGEFNIQKRQGKPIVEIIDVEVTGANTATVHYHLIDKGNGTNVTEHGIFWDIDEIDVDTATYEGYNSTYVNKINTGHIQGEDGCYRLNITIPDDLVPAGKTFYTKAYAVNNATPTALSNTSSVAAFTTFSNKPTVLTGGVSNITSNSAEANGKVLYAGTGEGTAITAQGIQVWKKYKKVNGQYVENTPTPDDLRPATDLSEFFTVSLEGLQNDTIYCMRAYATNVESPSYPSSYSFGETEEFRTLKDTPTMDGALTITGYELESDGKYKYTFKYTKATAGLTAYGFVISTDNDPELHADGDHTVGGTDHTSYFDGSQSGLEGGTTYYVRAYASKIVNPGTVISNYAVSTPIQFITPNANGDPVVRATEISGITRSSATITGLLVHKGSDDHPIQKYGVCWSSRNHHPDHDHCTDLDWSNPAPGSLDSGSTFNITLPDTLKPNTTYYVRIYATNGRTEEGSSDPVYVYSNDFNFTTLPVELPKMEVNVIDIGYNIATVECTVDTCGAGLVTPYGIWWKVDGGTYVQLSSDNYDKTTGKYTVVLDETTVPTTGLTADTKHWVKAYCSNFTGTANDGSGPNESREVSFMTLYPKPIVDAVTIDSIMYDASGTTSHTIRVYSNATAGAVSHPVQKFGYIYSTRSDATISTISSEYLEEAVEVGPSNMGSSHKTDLTAKVKDNREYWVRAYASAKASPTSDSDYSYGAAVKVLSLAQVNKVSNATTHKSAQLTARIASTDEEHFLRKYGICWKAKASGTPTVDDAHYEEDITSTPMDFSLNTSQAGSNLAPGEYYWRAYVKNRDYTTASAYKGVAYTTDGTFKIYQYGITTEVVPAGSGSVSGGGYYDTIVGGVSPAVNLIANTSGSDYVFEKWTKIPDATGIEEDAGDDNPLVISEGTMVSAHYKAWFTSKVTVTAGAGGQVRFGTTGDYSATANQQFSYDASCTVSAQASSGYTFVNWTDADGNMVSDEAEYTFDVTGAITLTANFTGRGNTSTNSATPRPRDIYPAPAREPWDWDNDDFCVAQSVQTDTITDDEDEELRAVRDRLSRDGVVAPEDIPQIIENRATEGRGGGIFMTNSDPDHPTKLVFSGPMDDGGTDYGRIIYNHAAEAGGGIYIDEKAYMQMKGRCEVNYNHVPAGKRGGGIYLDGRLYVGESKSDAPTAHALKVNRNFAIDVADNNNPEEIAAILDEGLSAEEKLLRSNVELPKNVYDWILSGSNAGDDVASVITLLSDISGETGSKESNTSIGFSVHQGFCPVIATSKAFSESYLNQGENDGDEGNIGYFNKYDGDTYNETLNAVYEPWLSKLMPSSDGGVMGDDGAVFEDTETYIAIHSLVDNSPFRAKYIYLWGSWTNPVVSEDPETENPMTNNPSTSENFLGHYKIIDKTDDILTWEIYSEKGLSWFSSYVNGLNAFTPGHHTTENPDPDHKDYEWDAEKNPYAKAILMNDLDMRKYFWVPIGSVTSFSGEPNPENPSANIYLDDDTHPYKGEFDGQGHIIEGLDCRYLTGVKKYGLFGELASDPSGPNSKHAVVKNVFIDDSQFISDKATQGYFVGGIAGKMSGDAVLSGSEVRSRIDVTTGLKSDTYVGGLVGKMEGTAVVHSSMAMPEIVGTAGYMGGLVGQVNATNKLLNSFSNPKFPNAITPPYYNMMGSGRFIGGLVGDNQGIVENCYSRLQGDEPTYDGTHSVFGWFAGTNTVEAGPNSTENPNNMGGIRFCYAPLGATDYVKSIAYPDFLNGTFGVEVIDQNPGHEVPYGHGNYSETVRVSGKYGFKHRDHQMTPVVENDAIYITDKTNDTLIGGLMHALNGWVKASGNGWKLNEGTGQYYNENDYAVWSRTMASPINDDYPVLMLEDFNALGSEDSIYLHYKHNVDDLIDAYSYTKIDHEKHPTPSIYLYDTVADGMENGKPKPVPIKKSNIVKIGGKDVMFPMLAINEDVGILQNVELMARTGVTIRNNRKGDNDFTDNPNWHLFSSSVEAAPIGLEYHTLDAGTYDNPNVNVSVYGYQEGTYAENIPTVYTASPPIIKDKHPQEVWERRKYWDPPQTTWFQSDIDSEHGGVSYNADGSQIGYFPTNTPYGTWRPGTSGGHVASAEDGFFDLYVYSEYYYHWINYKREGTDTIQDHWHWDKDAGDSDGNGKGEHYRIGYTAGEKYINDTEWESGKGYLMALSSESMMMADGVLNNSDGTSNIEIPVTNTPIGNNLPPNGHGSYNYSVPWRSLNLIGNPYQSYLDFDEFVKANGGGSDLSEKNYCYAVIDDSKSLDVEDRYIYYTTKQSDNPVYSASQFIHPHQGFFVKVAANGNLKFNNTMRVAGKTGVISAFNSPYRSQVNYPLVNLLCYDEDGRMDLTTVEVNRPEFGGGHKMEKLHESKGLIYAHLENESFQTLFTPVGTNVVPVRFIPNEDGMFTLNWNTLHGEFSYLHLIDNITGVDVDCLTNDEYKFEGKTSDYKSRFKLVFRCDGDEPEDPEEPDNPDDGEDSDHFAFMFGDELVVNGEGMLQMFDVQGRCLMETRAVGQQSSHSLPSVAAGVYVFRLTGDKRVKVQKMVIK